MLKDGLQYGEVATPSVARLTLSCYNHLNGIYEVKW